MSIPTAAEFKEAAISMMFEQQVWAKEHFQLNNLPIKVKFSDRNLNYLGQASVKRDAQGRLEAYVMQICSHHYLRHPVLSYAEYASFNDHPVIGGFSTNDWRLSLQALVAHEMAHLIQYALRNSAFDEVVYGGHPLVSGWDGIVPVFGMKYGRYEGHHGKFFQSIYSDFRTRWINNQVDRSAFNTPRRSFQVPDTFDERLAAMPKSGLEGIRFMSNGRMLTVAGRNPNRNRLFNYQVHDDQGNFLKIKLSLIAFRSPDALTIINHDPELYQEYREHILAAQTKARANKKSSMVKQGLAARKAR